MIKLMTKEQINWLWDRCVNHQHGLMATTGSELDLKLREIEKVGGIKCYDSMFGNNYYSLTEAGKKAIHPIPPRRLPKSETNKNQD